MELLGDTLLTTLFNTLNGLLLYAIKGDSGNKQAHYIMLLGDTTRHIVCMRCGKLLEGTLRALW